MVLMDNHHTDMHSTSSLKSPDLATTSTRPNQKKTRLQRSCIVTKKEADKSSLLRFVRNQDGHLYFDLTQKLPGRGVYLSPTSSALETAVKKNLFAKALKKQVDVPETLLDQIETQLRQSILDHLNMARRAGDLIISQDKIEKYIKDNKIACYITSSSEDTDNRRRLETRMGNAPTISIFSNTDLSETLKLENVVHLALKQGKIASSFLDRMDIYNQLEVKRK